MTGPAVASPSPQATPAVDRRTPPWAAGEPMVWLMGAALVVCLLLVVGIVAVIVTRGGSTFWPLPIDRVALRSGESFLGVEVGRQSFIPDAAERDRLAALGAIDDEGRAERRRFRTGNRDLGGEPFRWVLAADIASTERPAEALLIERRQWGPFLGVPSEITLDGAAVASGSADVLAALPEAVRAARARAAEMDRLTGREVPALQEAVNRLDWRERRVRRRAEGPGGAEAAEGAGRTRAPIGWPAWLGLVGLAAAGAVTWRAASRARAEGATGRVLPGGSVASRAWLARAAPLAAAVTLVASLAVVLERPWHGGPLSPAQAEARLAAIAQERATLAERRASVEAELERLRREDARHRLVIVDPASGRFAPASQAEAGEPMRLSQVVRAVPANTLTFAGRVGVSLARWRAFLADPPGETAGDGGVFPVILGTVTLTLLLTVCVVPLGVIAALYLREYAHQGVVTSAVRIAINNLAGVPSIVYGMFGLGFFCYTLGAYIDAGPAGVGGAEHAAAALPRGTWWFFLAAAAVLTALGASALAVVRAPGGRGGGRRVARFLTWALWLAAAALAAAFLWRTPYFHGFFADKLPEQPTFGGRGILWGSLTLALLTLPVVIVATEEAIAAVPRSMREGSYGCGASRWQTVRRIVLPAAMPGIMTGAILAMARGAGEVAPLMLVGAVNLAPAPPVTADPPFLHGDRTFMHLGFHIYNLGFQNPDPESALPLVWTTTLLLVAIVLVLNLSAVVLRARLRSRLKVAAV